MRRELLLISLGALPGAIAAHYLDSRIAAGSRMFSETTEPTPEPRLNDVATSPRDFRSAFDALRAVVGNNERDLAAALASLSQPEGAEGLPVELIAAAARISPSAALRQAVLIDDRAERARALERIAAIWAGIDPRAALATLDVIGDAPLRDVFQAAVLREWARDDPLAMIAYLGERGGDMTPREAAISQAAFDEILDIDVDQMLALADRLPASIRDVARRTALMRLAEENPLHAIDYVAEIPAGSYRDVLLMSIARGYARNNPDAALAWARDFDSPILDRVLWVVAERDPARAVSMTLAMEPVSERLQAMQALLYNGQVDPRVFADRVLALPDSGLRDRAVQMLAGVWISRDADAAFEWLIGNAVRIGVDSFAELAQQVGYQNPIAAARVANQIPSNARGAWIQGIANSYGRADPKDALAWIEQFAGAPGYNVAVSELVQTAAAHDPQAAARLLARVSDTSLASYRGAAGSVAYYLARENPAAAAQWALTLDDAQARQFAIGAVARQWAEANAPAARSWAISLPQGDMRDSALTSLLYRIAEDRIPDGDLLGAFSVENARTEASRGIVVVLAQRNRDDARTWIESQITDPVERERAERLLETGAFKRGTR
jgi:hypothetical protein